MYSLRFATFGRQKLDIAEAKRNSRFEEVELMAMLDQCKRTHIINVEILREDKIFIRNKIKNNDQETINIFKRFRKPATGKAISNSDLQGLQVQLRKHVTVLKSRFKNEQLMKFR